LLQNQDEFLARARRNEPLRWPMRPGAHHLVAADTSGASAAVTFSVLARAPASP